MTNDDLYRLVATIEQKSEYPLGKAIVSKHMMHTIKINLSFALILNGIAIILAMIGTLSPVWGALVLNGGSLLVVLNSALLLSWKYKTNSDEDRNPYVGKLVSNQ